MEHDERILVTHVGSLVRPPELVDFLRKMDNEEPCDRAAFERTLRSAIDDVVRRQAEIGVDIVSDGEFGKGVNWAFYVHKRLGGIHHRPFTPEEENDPLLVANSGPDRKEFAEFYKEYEAAGGASYRRRTRVICDGPLVYTGQDQVQRDIANLKAAAAKTDVAGAFLPVVAPASALPNVKDEHYGSEEKFLFGLAEALRVEYKAIVDAGLYVQIDDAFLTTQYERMVPPLTLQGYRRWVEMRIEALNHALEGIPAERARYHICWGSWNGPHVYDVPLKDIVDLVLKVNVGAYLFEAANPRHEHEWQVWKTVKVPAGKTLVPGVVSHATNIVEHPELVAERLVRFANIVGREHVMAGTDCGFAQSPFLRRVHPSIQWAKLKALADGAALATAALWSRSAA